VRVDARKASLKLRDALALLAEVDVIYAARGAKVERFDLRKGRPDEATLARILLGPTGNLRAPTVRRGRTLVVGFEEETYRSVFG
jgi:hypothetical protein